MKKMMILCGSPREKGNTITVVRWVAAAAREGGADVEIVVADKLTYKAYGCTGCMSCQNSDTFRCVIGDDASEVIARIPEQDVLVFATPVYFMGFSAQLKLVIDRMFSLFKIHPESIDYAPSLTDTSLALIATGSGTEDQGMELVVKNMDAIAGFIGAPAKKFLAPEVSLGPSRLYENEKLKARAFEFGTSLVSE